MMPSRQLTFPRQQTDMSGVVLVVGSGGREHALTLALASCPAVTSVLVTPGNAGTLAAPKASHITLPLKDHQAVAAACVEHGVSLVVVGPEDPLAQGLANSLTAAGIKVFGPTKEAARIEADKSWAKSFMNRHSIPTAAHQTFITTQEAKTFINKQQWAGFAVKASGLSAGKGVIVADTAADACQAVDTISSSFGEAGQTIVVEEKLVGEEISVLCFTDGVDAAVMPPAQDHKRLGDGDQGPNTGGMGAYCPCPLASQQDLDIIKKDVLQKAVDGLRKEGTPFVGVLYAGLMLTVDGPKVLEFNCRFGDPETQVLLPLLEGDLYDIMMACVEGRLGKVAVPFSQDKSCVGVCVVSGGYPGSYPKGKTITGVDEVSGEAGVQVIHAGTKREGSSLVTSGGRVLAVVVTGAALRDTADRATQLAGRITFEGATFRRDIAARATKVTSRFGGGGVTYKDSGVDINAGNEFVAAIKEAAGATACPGVMGSLGSFGGLFDLRQTGFRDPILVSGTDGVGTKLKVAQAAGMHDTVGQDLVAMCVNDVLVHGARPLFFLDYYSTGRLEGQVAASVVKGVARACSLAGCALIGGETAEMPGMYAGGEYDLAGFTVGAVERGNMLPRTEEVAEGDVLVGLPSSGLHSNGFSLVRRIIEAQDLQYSDPAPFNPDNTLGAELLTPTRIYCRSLAKVLEDGLVKAAAHITGGGLLENLPRVLPSQLSAHLQASQWPLHPVFGWLAAHGVCSEEMARTFNCGLGMVLVVAADKVMEVISLIPGGEARQVGQLVPRKEGMPQVVVEELEQILSAAAAPLLIQCPSLTTPRRRVAVLISGTGTNLQALLDHTKGGLSGAEVVVVVSNVAGVKGLQRAQEAGVTTKVVPHKNYKSREEFEAAVNAELQAARAELICLAGFMRILTGSFVRAWRGRLLNIHPSLLPAFKGMHAQRQALQAGVTLTGCTVHFVSEEVDCGAIVTQEAVPVLPGDTEEALVERIKTAEHRAYPRAMELVARGKVVLREDGTCIRS
ncbi:trifunctional purine biosynthetic protein adenosine-3-like isoform X2 [Scylla paramamosain]|uniref:trifunctional purine biosynthetic protein adenosine-3-like isoform X2 n=1 Tax=Scylla paramamosain TaxID=85552 RepID=UPI003083D6FB